MCLSGELLRGAPRFSVCGAQNHSHHSHDTPVVPVIKTSTSSLHLMATHGKTTNHKRSYSGGFYWELAIQGVEELW